ncbi:hypothetical protein [Nocardia sp. NPDC020380]|uniref:hypothetical protein n=1 Tax=Nocardia sp. NPDC020380 TaxID=3364309 RepID=UPI00379BE5A5
MRFDDSFFSREYWFSLGREGGTGKYYLSIPVSNGLVDYEEYYEIPELTFERFMQDPSSAVEFAESCRHQQMDALLIVPAPATGRGTAV